MGNGLPLAAVTPRESFHRDIVVAYDTWMKDLGGLAAATRSNRKAEAQRFLGWLEERSDPTSLSGIGVADIDAYVQCRVSSLDRASTHNLAANLRSFLRHLF